MLHLGCSSKVSAGRAASFPECPQEGKNKILFPVPNAPCSFPQISFVPAKQLRAELISAPQEIWELCEAFFSGKK